MLFPVSMFKKEKFIEEMSSLAGLTKKFFSFYQKYKSTDFGYFWLPKSTFNVDILNPQEKLAKNP